MLNQEIKNLSQRFDISKSLSPDDVNKVVGVPKVITEVDDTGKLVSKLVFEATPLEKLNDGLRVDDFAIEVLLQNGYDFHRMDVNSSSFEDIDGLTQVANSLPLDEEVKQRVKPYVKNGKE